MNTLSESEFLAEFGMTISDAKAKLEQDKAASNKPWQKILADISYKSSHQTTKQMIEWRIELQRREKTANSFN